MATKAKAAKGTLLKRGDGAVSEVFTTIAEVSTISGPETTVETVDATSHDSSAAEFISTALPDNGEIGFEFNYVPGNAQQEGLVTDMNAGTLRNFQLICPTTHASTPMTFAFAAIVTKCGPMALGTKDAIRFSGTLKISGAITRTWAPAS